MEELLKELKNAEIENDWDVDFYNGVIYALYKIGKLNEKQKIAIENEIKLKHYAIK